MRCLTITLNASVDTTYIVDGYRRGGIARAVQTIAVAGGKGNNVARVLARLGNTVTASGFIAGRAGRLIEHRLREEGISPAFLRVPGESRTCLSLVELNSGITSEIREPGITVAARYAQRFLSHSRDIASDADCIAISGSLPPGLPGDYYAALMNRLRELPALIALDSSGQALREGLAGQPHLIAPNEDELRELAGLSHRAALVAWVQHDLLGGRLARDAQVLLSLGGAGAALITHNNLLYAPAPAVQVASPVGCGDALLAGYLSAYCRRRDPAQALCEAVAVASAAALELAPGAVRVEQVAQLRQAVGIQPWPYSTTLE